MFSHWCTFKVFPVLKKIGRKAVLVLDRISYHNVLDEHDKRPVQSQNKKRIVNSILRWDGVPDTWPLAWAHEKSKFQLLEHTNKIYPAPNIRYKR